MSEYAAPVPPGVGASAAVPRPVPKPAPAQAASLPPVSPPASGDVVSTVPPPDARLAPEPSFPLDATPDAVPLDPAAESLIEPPAQVILVPPMPRLRPARPGVSAPAAPPRTVAPPMVLTPQ